MNGTWIIEEAKKNEERVIFHRRHLHETAEVGFDLKNTHDYVFNLLKELGCQPKKCGKMGIVAKIKGESENFAFLQYNSSINLDEMKEKKVTKNKIFSKKK